MNIKKKRALAIAGIAAGNSVLCFLLGSGSLLLLLGFTPASLLPFAIVFGHCAAAVFLQKKLGLNKIMFWLWSGLPSAALGGILFGVMLYLDSINYFSGFFAGLGRFLLSEAFFGYSAAYFVLLGIITAADSIISRVIAQKNPK